ncbi:MAG: aldehyde ferredoxin oxidoreductase family protein [Thermoproteus sp. AZ2]|uniref:Aldehyde ferredoxin oxidoreductase family protein n=1 Tax=Thermoproteus sp. AZ2 TaxID=1609232 RepID=A0ACC6V357_9CREN
MDYSFRAIYVDLSKKTYSKRAIEGSLIKAFVGGRGLASWLFYELRGYAVDPLSPDNPLIIASGPLGGTRVPMATRAYAVFRSPQTGIFGGSNVGGTLGARMRYAGVDVLVVVGKAERPTTLVVRGDEVRFEDASPLWGRDAIETEMELKKDYGRDAAVLAIGPAGENLVKFAAINHEYWRQLGRTGGGAVMGSKKLKAIVFQPIKNEAPLAHPDKLDKWIREFMPKFLKDPTVRAVNENGTLRIIDVGNQMGFFPAYNWTRLSLDGWEAISWSKKIKPEYFLRPEACLYCPAACHRPVKSKRFNITVDLEYETTALMAGATGLKDVDWLIKLNDLADRLGMDSISLGGTLAFAIEASKRGKLPIRLDWGDGEALAKLVEDIAYRRGVGDLLAEGSARAAKALGLEDAAVHVKGLEPAGYDPRILRGMALNYAIAYRGADHLATSIYALDIAGLAGGTYSLGREKVEAVVHMENMMALMDSLVLCKFGRTAYDTYPGGRAAEIFAEVLEYATGLGWTPQDVRDAGERIVQLNRWMNVKMGVTRRDDYLPKRWMEPAQFEGVERRITAEELDSALDYYYDLRGWDKNGIPKSESLIRYGLNLG